MSGKSQPFIIKRKKVVQGGGHHGGAWKVAYADFVTAMMAFFLLMWLLNATTEDQRKGLADYFDPAIPISRISGGGNGALNGTSLFSEDTLARDGAGASERFEASMAPGNEVNDSDDAEAREREAYQTVEEKIKKQRELVSSTDLADHIQTRMTPDGLVVELIDRDDEPLFEIGSVQPSPLLDELFAVIAPVLATTRNDMQIVGHTDALAYVGGGGYSNWDLSSARANIARRMLVEHGLPASQIVGVVGKADVEPLSPDPLASQNRRIAVVLLAKGRQPR